MADKYESFYSNQTVFLTGGTGGLGTCILHKLVTELPTKKIYVLVRSKEKALRTWKASIPNQVDAIVNSDRVVFVLGDISKVNLGIETSMRAQMRADTTVVINSVSHLIQIKSHGLQETKPHIQLSDECSRWKFG